MSIKSECLDKMILFGEKHVRYVIEQYNAHYLTERPTSGSGPADHRARDADADRRRGPLPRAAGRAAEDVLPQGRLTGSAQRLAGFSARRPGWPAPAPAPALPSIASATDLGYRWAGPCRPASPPSRQDAIGRPRSCIGPTAGTAPFAESATILAPGRAHVIALETPSRRTAAEDPALAAGVACQRLPGGQAFGILALTAL